MFHQCKSRLTRCSALVVLTLCWSVGSIAQAQTEERRMQLEVNQQTTLPSDGVANYSLEGESVRVTVDPTTTDFVIVARETGISTLLLLYGDGRRVLYRISVGDISVPRRDNIQLDFYFVQLAEDYNHQIGVGWPASFGSDSEGFSFDFSLTADILNGFNITGANATLSAQPLPRIDFLQSSGWARVMRQASVVTSNGQRAYFEGGEEVNFIASTGLNANVQSIRAGAKVIVTPRYDRVTGRVDLQVESEMSDLTRALNGVPGRILANVDTTVNLEMGQSVILGGLVSDSESNSQGGVPILSQIPVVGVLFGSHSNRRNYTQTVLFIIPSIVDTVSDDVRLRINEALETYWDYSGGLDDIHVYEPAAGPSPLHPDALGAQPRDLGRRRGTPPRPSPSNGSSEESAPSENEENWRRRR